ncbi:hypothetical protein HMJ29_09265 [Hymenobacter taeanensis]|uniref:Glycosyltransferase RgtA/B/C/D-like domain-containing protein n=1 Tax=Hymenobacter taeanensis TaxID=2735321 RepID=A0A6M6BIH8_9BACT|nr:MULTISPECIES: hypothetical protein [Hymenobacter]QJX47113.1 hypothetical protein HMJ29_09265 [Hymenobacter taeanensis]UOQ81027.1 hypothetical protein MUN83_19810 [Hymenobacter sp. 5414T-23]
MLVTPPSAVASPATQAVAPGPGPHWLRQWHGWLLVGLWVLVQLSLLWQHHGPRYVNDSGRYLAYGTRIAQEWHFEHDHNLRYVGYPLFISFWLKVGAGWWGIALGQIAIAGVAARAFYSTLRRLTPARLDWRPAALATAALIGWRDAQQFNVYILTESLFASLTILSFWALCRARQTGARGWLLFGLLALVTGIVRPNGFVVAAAGVVAALVGLRMQPGQGTYRRAWLGLLLLTPIFWVILNKLLLTFTLVETYLRGEIIYGYTSWVVEPTEPLLLPPPGLAPVLRLGYFICCNPVYFTKLALLKGGLFLSHVKSYYSWSHIVLIVLFIYPCYWLAWQGARATWAWLPVRTFLVAVVLIQGAVVMMTVEDWDVRFLLPVLPCVFALVGLRLVTLLPRPQQA